MFLSVILRTLAWKLSGLPVIIHIPGSAALRGDQGSRFLTDTLVDSSVHYNLRSTSLKGLCMVQNLQNFKNLCNPLRGVLRVKW